MEKPTKFKEGDTARSDTSNGGSKKTGRTDSNTLRKRVSQACDRCRLRKDKCDGKKPSCSSCVALGQHCSWEPSTKKRGLPEGYVRGLEKLWGLTIREADGVEDRVLSLLDGADVSDSRPAQLWNERNANEYVLLDSWRQSRISRELERLLPVLECSDEKGVKRKRQESTVSRVKDDIPDASPSSISGMEAGYSKSLDINPGATPILPDLSSQVELPGGAWQLLDIYFSYTQCWLPIIEKHNLLKTSYQYPQGSRMTHFTKGSGDHAALWAVLAYADHQRKSFLQSNISASVDNSPWTSAEICRYARSLIPSEDGEFEIGHLQALLVLTLLSMGKDQWKKAWFLIGYAVRIAIDLELNDSEASIRAGKFERRRHIFLSCFALDTLVAHRLNRAPQLRSEDINDIGLVEEDGLDEWDPWTDVLELRHAAKAGPRGPASTLSTFNRFIRIMKILNDIVCDKSGTVLENQENIQSELESCCQSSKASLTTPGDTLLPHRFHLYITHIGVTSLIPNDSVPLEELPAFRAARVLRKYLSEYRFAIIPPTVDCFLQMAKLGDYFAKEQPGVQDIMPKLVQAWPTFDHFFPKAKKPDAPSPMDIQMIDPSKMHNLAQSSRTVETHDSIRGLIPPIFNKDGFTPNIDRALDRPNPNFLQTPLSSNGSQFPFDSLLGSPSNTTNTTVNSGHIWQPQSPAYNLSMIPPGADALPPAYRASVFSENDVDSIFNEFATLDATKWANNWDQSLMNLGFTDPDKMNQDFYAFCREPDPLYSANLQQLLSNTTSPQLQPVFDDSLVGFPNPHVEASQILQALSTTGDGRRMVGGPQ